MSVKIKRNTIKIISIIIAILLIVAVSAVIIGAVIPNIKRNQTKNKLSQINVEELQIKMIEELEKTPLNINTNELNTTFGTLEEVEESSREKNINQYIFSGVKANYELSGNLDSFKSYISAYIIGQNNELIIIPCFKIESDSNGNFKSIKCKTSQISHEVPDIFIKVLEKDFGIKLEGKYKSEIQKSDKDDITIYSLKEDDLINVAKKYLNMYGVGSTSQQSQLVKEESKSMTIFGIDK